MSDEANASFRFTLSLTGQEAVRTIVTVGRDSGDPVIAADATDEEVRSALKYATIQLRDSSRHSTPSLSPAETAKVREALHRLANICAWSGKASGQKIAEEALALLEKQ